MTVYAGCDFHFSKAVKIVMTSSGRPSAPICGADSSHLQAAVSVFSLRRPAAVTLGCEERQGGAPALHHRLRKWTSNEQRSECVPRCHVSRSPKLSRGILCARRTLCRMDASAPVRLGPTECFAGKAERINGSPVGTAQERSIPFVRPDQLHRTANGPGLSPAV
jgi:hypothetical protein